MKIGIDLHGVIDDNISFFKELLETLCSTNIEIYIISGPPTEDIKRELDEHGLKEGLHYHRIFSVVDYLKSKDVFMWLDEKNTWWAGDGYWWGAKAGICNDEGVDLMIDDSRRYGPDFKNVKTEFLLYKPKYPLLFGKMESKNEEEEKMSWKRDIKDSWEIYLIYAILGVVLVIGAAVFIFKVMSNIPW